MTKPRISEKERSHIRNMKENKMIDTFIANGFTTTAMSPDDINFLGNALHRQSRGHAGKARKAAFKEFLELTGTKVKDWGRSSRTNRSAAKKSNANQGSTTGTHGTQVPQTPPPASSTGPQSQSQAVSTEIEFPGPQVPQTLSSESSTGTKAVGRRNEGRDAQKVAHQSSTSIQDTLVPHSLGSAGPQVPQTPRPEGLAGPQSTGLLPTHTDILRYHAENSLPISNPATPLPPSHPVPKMSFLNLLNPAN